MNPKSEISLKRRRLAGLLLLAGAPLPTLAAAPMTQAKSRNLPVINVRALGAFGDGKLPDLSQVQAAFQRAAQHPAGAVVLFPPGEYSLGAADEAYLAVGTRLQNVRVVGERATITCRSVNGASSMFVFEGCRNVTIEGLTFRDHGLRRDVGVRGAAAIRLANEEGRPCENIEIRDCKFDSVMSAFVCRETDKRVRTRGIRMTNLEISRSYYGLSFQHNGDDVVARAIRCNDVKRSYFPYGIDNHDIEVEAVNNATGFTDALIKCYHRDTSNVRLKLKSRGKRGGDCIVNFDHHNEVPNLALRNIKVDLDVDDVDCHLDAAIMFRALDRNELLERQTNRRWEGISIDGDVRICKSTSLFDFRSVGKVPGTVYIGPRLARHPKLPRAFPGYAVQVAAT
jgi:hypothetical protein